MKKNSKILMVLALPVLLLIAALVAWQQQLAAPKIRIGVLHSLTGTMATSEKPLVDALRLAITEANAAGGIQGRQIEAVVADCRSDAAYCAQQAERLIAQEKVSALFGCWTSICRKAVKPVVEKHRHLLFYPVQYEGMEMSPNIIYTGAAPNQQIIPGTTWALKSLGKRVYLVGSDYAFPRLANIIIKDLLAAQGGVLTGERYVPLGGSDMDAVVTDIAKQRAEVVLNTLNGDSNAHLFTALKKAGLADLPLVSFSVEEAGMKVWGGNHLGQHYGVWNYFQTLPGEHNRRFVAAFKARFGADRITSDPMETSYIGLLLWVQAAREAGSAEPAQVQRVILRQSLNAPEGIVAVDPATRHLWKTPRIGKIRPDGQFDIVWDAARTQKPTPFPSYRFRDEWLELLQSAKGVRP
jgi:urea transport system substrate-binding protein